MRLMNRVNRHARLLAYAIPLSVYVGRQISDRLCHDIHWIDLLDLR